MTDDEWWSAVDYPEELFISEYIECKCCNKKLTVSELYDHLCEEALIRGARLFDKDGRVRLVDTLAAARKLPNMPALVLDSLKNELARALALDGAGICPCGTKWTKETKTCKCITG